MTGMWGSLYETERQTNSAKWRISVGEMYRIICVESGSLIILVVVWVISSTFDEDMREKRFFRFSSLWPLDRKFCDHATANYSGAALCFYELLRDFCSFSISRESEARKRHMDGPIDLRSVTLNAASEGRPHNNMYKRNLYVKYYEFLMCKALKGRAELTECNMLVRPKPLLTITNRI